MMRKRREYRIKEKNGEFLGNDKSETIKEDKIFKKRLGAMTLETYVKAGKRLRYKRINSETKMKNIEIF